MTSPFLALASLRGAGASLRRVRTTAGALRFNKAVGQIITADVKDDPSMDRSATLQRMLSLYNRMRAAKLYGQEDQFKRAAAEMADAIDKYSKRHPGGADRMRSIVSSLSFKDEEAQRRQALGARDSKKK